MAELHRGVRQRVMLVGVLEPSVDLEFALDHVEVRLGVTISKALSPKSPMLILISLRQN